MKKKMYCFILMLALGLSGCEKVEIETTHIQHEIKSVEIIDKEIEVPEEYKESLKREVTEWSLAYAHYIEALKSASDFKYTLIYVDKDDIPELFVSTNCEAGGEIVVTYYQGEVIDYQLSRMGTNYIAYSGLLYTDTGHMDCYPVYITTLENGKFYIIAEGNRYLSDENRELLSEGGEYVLTYEWEETLVSEEEFDAHVAKYFDRDKSLYPEPDYSEVEMLYILNTGVWSSYEHSYELIQLDITWQEAAEMCKEKGGYLATITSPDEAKVIADQISSKKMENINFYVGYRLSEWIGEEFYLSRWINADGTYTESLFLEGLSDSYAPDYDYPNADGSDDMGEEECGLVRYYDSNGKIFVFEAAENLIEVSPELSGKIGFICEFDN